MFIKAQRSKSGRHFTRKQPISSPARRPCSFNWLRNESKISSFDGFDCPRRPKSIWVNQNGINTCYWTFIIHNFINCKAAIIYIKSLEWVKNWWSGVFYFAFYCSINSGLVSEIFSVGSSSEFASFNFDFVSSLNLIIFEIHSKIFCLIKLT